MAQSEEDLIPISVASQRDPSQTGVEPPFELVLATLNARWSHTAFGLRCLAANLGPYAARCHLVEGVCGDRAHRLVEAILERKPALVGLGVYIWNVELLEQVAGMLKRLEPDLPLVLGGPEVICAEDLPPIARHADWIVGGEGERAFAELVAAVHSGHPPDRGFLRAPEPDLAGLQLPYGLYTDLDIAHRAIYVEATRGCPFSCEFCLSSRDRRVRRFPEDPFLDALSELWERGARRFKFVDRCLHLSPGRRILDFFAARDEPFFLHFEVFPEALPDELVHAMADFPPGRIQVEAGVQSFADSVVSSLGRPRRRQILERRLTELVHETGVHLHADLIVGLPGERLEDLGAGFDRLVELGVAEIQVELLKRLRGTAIGRHEEAGTLVFAPSPPYEVLASDAMSFAEIQDLRRFSRVVDLVYNSGNYELTAPLLWGEGSPFFGLLRVSAWLETQAGPGLTISLHRLTRLLARFLCEERGVDPDRVEKSLAADYRRLGREPISLEPTKGGSRRRDPGVPPRQRRHLAGTEQREH